MPIRHIEIAISLMAPIIRPGFGYYRLNGGQIRVVRVWRWQITWRVSK